MNFLKRAVASASRRLWAPSPPSLVGNYHAVSLSEKEIDEEEYKKYLGGGADAWTTRGLFQLELLKDRGLSQTSSCLDLGCGPLRAGMHIIAYLGRGGYVGIDFNSSFINAAQGVIAKQGLLDKDPVVQLSTDFTISDPARIFDYAIAFSVLNHCDERSKKMFFDRIPARLGENGKLLISHAGWLTQERVCDAGLQVLDIIGSERYDLTRYGWSAEEAMKVFPIFELAKAPA